MAVTTFPTVYLDTIDEVLARATYASRYNVQGAEFVSGKQVSVPDISFGENAEAKAYDRFKTESDVTLNRTIYTLDHDVEKVFYLDALEVNDEPALSMVKVVSEYERLIFGPQVDKDFFKKVLENAYNKGKSTEAVTTENVKKLIRAARTQFTEAGLSGGDLYLTSEALGALEDVTHRQWGNDGAITDTIGTYNGFQVFEAPKSLTGADILAISGGQQTVRYITKRAVAYQFAPGQHTQGDGYLDQLRWVFGTIVRKNKKPGIWANVAA